jgi:hypothetical protein
MTNVDFYEDDNSGFKMKNTSRAQPSSLVKLLMKMGVIKNPEYGNGVLLVIALASFVLAGIVIYFFLFPKAGPVYMNPTLPPALKVFLTPNT